MNREVLFITNNFPAPEYRRTWKKAVSLSQEGYRVKIICPRNKNRIGLRKYRKIRVYYFKKNFSRNSLLSLFFGELLDFVKAANLTLKLYLKHKFKVIHFINPTDILGLIAVFLKIFGSTFIYEINENYPKKLKSQLTRHGFIQRLYLNFLKKLEKFLIKSADLIFVPNSLQKFRITPFVGHKKNKIVTIEPFPDLKDFYQPFINKDYKRGYKYMVLFSGSIRLKKEFIKLIGAINFILKDLGRKDILFVIAGDGKDKEKIAKHCSNLKINELVHFTGWLSQKKLLNYLNAADLGIVLESNDSKRVNIRDSIFEFMAVGKPLIAYNSKTGQSRIGEAGKFIEKGNEMLLAKEIIRTLDNRERSRIMGKIGKLRIEKKFNWIKSEIKLTSIYQSLFISHEIGSNHISANQQKP
ncbi:MAG: glycosyltransferase [Candidatus Moranbacteria bacterium]|nr:glycosyltransferase [Candidatus Moranbacteria bacterium]